MNNRPLFSKVQGFCGLWSLMLLWGCQDTSEIDEANLVDGQEMVSQAIRYGSLTPTLYPELTQEQQDSVVAICHRNRDLCLCTGSLLSPHVVLTAAHCFIGDETDHSFGLDLQAEHIEIRVGQDNRSAVNNRRYKVAKIFNYQADDGHYWFNKEYGDHYLINDWKIDKSIVILKDGIYDLTPLSIYPDSLTDLPAGTLMQVGGYGYTEDENGKLGTKNRTKYWTTMELRNTPSLLGTIGLRGNNTGTGKGDSGSPLLYKIGDEIKVLGVLSTGNDINSNYNQVYGYVDWIEDKINTYDPPQCLKACQGLGCGQVGDCTCGGCERGFICNDDHQCEKQEPGNGGFCFNSNPIMQFSGCESNADCPADQFCWKNDVANRCVNRCQPENCFPSDPYSWCLPNYVYDYSTAMNMCIISNLQPCAADAKLDSPCKDEVNGLVGICYNLEGKTDPLYCYPVCDNVATCKYDEACFPYDSCAATCEEGRCGVINGCDCGGCASGFTCDSGWCKIAEPIPGTDEDGNTDDSDNTDEVEHTDNQGNSNESQNNSSSSSEQNQAGKNESAASKKGCNAGGSGASEAALLALALLALRRKKAAAK